MDDGQINITVVIPYFNASFTIPSLVHALALQTLEKKDFEILFIDNASSDNSSELIERELAGTSINYRCLSFRDFPSSYAARNIGVTHACGEILVFTDADCRPHKDWLTNVKKNFEKSESRKLVLSGRVELVIEDKENVWELFDQHFHMDNTMAENNGRVATANMAVRKDFFENIGPFREVTSGADHEWSLRAQRAGARIIYDPEVLIFHPTRNSRDEILKKLRRTSFGLGEMSRSGTRAFFKGTFKTLFRPFLLHRHYRFATSDAFAASFGFRLKLYWIAFWLRCYQIPAYFNGLLQAPKAVNSEEK